MLFRIHRSELKRQVQELCLTRIAEKLAETEDRLGRQFVDFTEEVGPSAIIECPDLLHVVMRVGQG